jgi:integrase
VSGWIEKLPSGRFRARYRGPDGTRHSVIVATRAEAKTFLAGAHTDLNRGHWIDPRGGEETVAAWAVRWAEARVIRESTRCTDDGRLRTRIVPTFGALALKDITPLVVRSWVARMVADGLSPKTVRHYLMLFSLMMKDAVREGLLLHNPCEGTRLPQLQRTEQRALDPAELSRLIDAVDEWWRPLVVTAVGTGMRWGELAGLRPERVDLLHRRITVSETLTEVNGRLIPGPPKSRRSQRVIALPGQAVDALTAALARPHGEYVFSTEAGCAIRRHNFAKRVWRPATEAADVAGLRFHDLRHTHVALLIAGGVPLKAIQDRLGHESITTTIDRYGHLLPSVDTQLIDTLETQLPTQMLQVLPAAGS